MNNYVRCNNCGYDMYGHEFISNMVDTSLFNSTALHSDESILDLCQKSTSNMVCPFCNEKGSWSLT
ncbi:MAG: hypothetical protein ATN33_07840 [Epulopiscium sp. Nele67-Bin001]|nr:MAG: hypothetical protein BEN18_10945 [Epulopiscium sp. Nuni2H_MBin001]OON92167.1 MAG: hypothetical protein ATN33_07840 [Epulopiscium sp. Nele67-Bin001]